MQIKLVLHWNNEIVTPRITPASARRTQIQERVLLSQNGNRGNVILKREQKQIKYKKYYMCCSMYNFIGYIVPVAYLEIELLLREEFMIDKN